MTAQQRAEEIMTLDEIKNIFKTIVELVEDKTFPARRNITDYAEQLVPYEYRDEISKHVASLYDESDKKEVAL